MKKLVIANSGTAGQGKSTSIWEVFNQLSAKYPLKVNTIIDKGDILAIIEVHGVLVGIEGQGDPNSRMLWCKQYGQGTIDELRTKGCDIIVAACRTSGGTYNKIVDLNTTHGYDIIWSSNDKTNISKTHRDILNDRYAKRIIKLIEDRIAGII